MIDTWILNASPLIILNKADLLHTVSTLSPKWLIPDGVYEEISKKSDVEQIVSQMSFNARVERMNVTDINPVVSGWNLGRGESEVLSLALEENAGVVLDDLQARKCANVMEIPLIGTLGLVVKAKNTGIINKVKPAFEGIIKAGLYIDPEIQKDLMRKLKEE